MSAQELVDQLTQKGLTIAFAESMTGGHAVAGLIAIPGASAVVYGGIVAYQKEIKEKFLNVKQIEQYGLASEEVSAQMAKSIQKQFKTDIGVGITGSAGPNLEAGAEEPAAYIYIIYDNQQFFYKFQTNGDRIENIEKTVDLTYRKILEIIG